MLGEIIGVPRETGKWVKHADLQIDAVLEEPGKEFFDIGRN